MVERQPAIDTVGRAVNLQRAGEMPDLREHGFVGKRNALLEAGGAGRMLNESQLVRLRVEGGQVEFHAQLGRAAGANQLRAVMERDVTQQFLWKLLVDHDHSGPEVRRDSRQSKGILSWLNLEIRVRKNGGHRAQQHRSDEGRHSRDTLRHYDDDTITGPYTVIPQQPGLHAGTAPELPKSDVFELVLVNPGGREETIAGRGVQCVNQSMKSVHWLKISSRSAAHSITDASERSIHELRRCRALGHRNHEHAHQS